MSVLRPAQITNDASSVWMNAVQDNILEQRVSVSSDFLQTAGPTGKFISLNSKLRQRPNYMNYVGDWSPIDGYNIDDIVRVLPISGSYLDSPHFPWATGYVKTPIIISSNTAVQLPNPSIVGYSAQEGVVKIIKPGLLLPTMIFPFILPNYYPIPGTYICVSNVPSLEFYGVALWHSVWETIGGNLFNTPSSQTTYQTLQALPALLNSINYIRLWDVNYFPTWPEMTNTAIINPQALSGSWGRYWELISLLPTRMNICGKSGTSYVDSQTVPSGSANYTGSYNP
jgi:hypothetical protein